MYLHFDNFDFLKIVLFKPGVDEYKYFNFKVGLQLLVLITRNIKVYVICYIIYYSTFIIIIVIIVILLY